MNRGPVVSARMTDEELVAAYVGGSEDAFILLVGKYKNPLVNYVYRILGDYDDALDIVQDTFLRLHAKAHTYRPVAKFSTWIYTIASNLAKSDIRRRKWRMFTVTRLGGERAGSEPIFTDGGEGDARPDRSTDHVLMSEAVQKALMGLPVEYRQAVVLFYLEDLAYEEICGILGIRIGTLKSRLSRGRKMLGRALGPWMEDHD
jgi:RNA polymerase sigma-70 factor (ECF subfamily)